MARSTALSASCILDITHIPRQTVRRKLLLLQRRGWIEQDGMLGGRLIIRGTVSPAADDLKALDARGIQRAVGLHAAFSAILAGKPPLLL
jgi:DNA-binding IclR family transcriptional regulator